MAIQISESFQLYAHTPLDSRSQFKTVAEMRNFPTSRLYEGILAAVVENNTTYQFFSSNENTEETGKWRKFETGGTGSGEENKINSISVNGSAVSIDENKNVDITIPSIEGLATETYVTEQITNAEHLKRKIITVLPSDSEADDNIIYMLKVESATGNDKYQEYMKIDGALQMVGDTSTDLTDYAKKADIPTMLPANGGNADTVNGHTVETDVPANAVFTDTVYDDTDIKAEIANKADITAIPSKVSDLENDSNYQTAEQVNSTVTAGIAKVVADAPEDFDTLKELSDWIAGHENDASAMNSAISDNKTNIETLQNNVSDIQTSLDKKLDKTFTGEAVANKILSTDESGNVVLKDISSGGGTAETTTYTNADYPDYTNVDLALDALFNKVYYVKPTCLLSADKKGGIFEIGTVISAPITFSWSTNKDVTSQTLTDCTLEDANVRTATYNTNIATDKTFTLVVSDGENSASSSISYKFMDNIFWGSSAIAETYDSAFINALSNKKLTTSVKGTYSFNLADNEYGFWAVPTSMGISSVWIGGFEVTVDYLGPVSYINAQGIPRQYDIYKTGKSGLGAISAEIK